MAADWKHETIQSSLKKHLTPELLESYLMAYSDYQSGTIKKKDYEPDQILNNNKDSLLNIINELIKEWDKTNENN